MALRLPDTLGYLPTPHPLPKFIFGSLRPSCRSFIHSFGLYKSSWHQYWWNKSRMTPNTAKRPLNISNFSPITTTIKEPMKIHEEKDRISFLLDLRVPDMYYSSLMAHTLAWIIIDPETMTFFFKIFWCGPFLESLLNLLQYYFSFYVLVFWSWGIWDLSSPTRYQTCTPALEGELNY